MTTRKSSRSTPATASILDELGAIMAGIAESAEAAMQNTQDTPHVKKAAERMLRATTRGLAILETLRSTREK